MPYVRKLPSGRFQATVRDPAGKRITKTFPLERQAKSWGADLEADMRRGDFVDPRRASTTVGKVWDDYSHSRRLEKASRKRDESTWRNHVEPRWGTTPVGTIVRPAVAAWVNEMQQAGTKPWTIIAAVNVLTAVLEIAVDAGMIRGNPARRVRRPVPPKHEERIVDPAEMAAILDRADQLFPDRRDAGVFVEGLGETGARWEELAAVRREAVDLRRSVVRLGPVVERDGTIREYPKAARHGEAAGFRSVPISPGYARRLKPLVLATAPGGLVFTAPKGGVMLYPTWLRRVWNRIVTVVDEPAPTPHDLRHTYGTRLADLGMERHDIMALMGHEDYRTSGRYIHSDEDKRIDRARQAFGWRHDDAGDLPTVTPASPTVGSR